MSETVQVIRETEALYEAYKMGFNRGDQIGDPPADPIESLSYIKEGAQYVNNVAPSLRALSGFTDHKGGTYQVENQVAVIPHGNEEDSPAEAELMNSRYVFESVQSAYDRGFLDAADGREFDDSRTELII